MHAWYQPTIHFRDDLLAVAKILMKQEIFWGYNHFCSKFVCRQWVKIIQHIKIKEINVIKTAVFYLKRSKMLKILCCELPTNEWHILGDHTIHNFVKLRQATALPCRDDHSSCVSESFQLCKRTLEERDTVLALGYLFVDSSKELIVYSLAHHTYSDTWLNTWVVLD